jgi:hypothetical protein
MRINPAPAPPRRTFARVVGFDLACPNCGAVDAVRSASGLPWWKGTKCFDWWRSRWRCRACRRVFAVGLVLWPTRRAGNRPRGGGQPVDTVPSTVQAGSLQLVYGLVRTQTRGWYDPVNLICTCASDDHRHAPDCPLSDDEAF